MNREIKFRFWLGLNKKMTYSHRLYWVATLHPDEMSGLLDGTIIPLQYTGIKDKNGGYIYEGDILKFDLIGLDDEHPPEKGLKGQVKCMNIGCLVFGGWNYEFCTNIEIIGNIFENPEIINQ